MVVPQADPHFGEYLAAHWQVRRWLSGFTGSAGDLVVTLDRALLWTDSRYFIQAAAQLDGSGIELMKDGLAETPSIAAFLCSALPAGSRVVLTECCSALLRWRLFASRLESAVSISIAISTRLAAFGATVRRFPTARYLSTTVNMPDRAPAGRSKMFSAPLKARCCGRFRVGSRRDSVDSEHTLQ